jgi:small nuclear ribonucleoprotein (snRNP)-like protein
MFRFGTGTGTYVQSLETVDAISNLILRQVSETVRSSRWGEDFNFSGEEKKREREGFQGNFLASR